MRYEAYEFEDYEDGRYCYDEAKVTFYYVAGKVYREDELVSKYSNAKLGEDGTEELLSFEGSTEDGDEKVAHIHTYRIFGYEHLGEVRKVETWCYHISIRTGRLLKRELRNTITGTELKSWLVDRALTEMEDVF